MIQPFWRYISTSNSRCLSLLIPATATILSCTQHITWLQSVASLNYVTELNGIHLKVSWFCLVHLIIFVLGKYKKILFVHRIFLWSDLSVSMSLICTEESRPWLPGVRLVRRVTRPGVRTCAAAKNCAETAVTYHYIMTRHTQIGSINLHYHQTFVNKTI